MKPIHQTVPKKASATARAPKIRPQSASRQFLRNQAKELVNRIAPQQAPRMRGEPCRISRVSELVGRVWDHSSTMRNMADAIIQTRIHVSRWAPASLMLRKDKISRALSKGAHHGEEKVEGAVNSFDFGFLSFDLPNRMKGVL
jgi:hypothetical protein